MLLDSNILIYATNQPTPENLSLVTRNQENFKRVPGLRVVNPFLAEDGHIKNPTGK